MCTVCVCLWKGIIKRSSLMVLITLLVLLVEESDTFLTDSSQRLESHPFMNHTTIFTLHVCRCNQLANLVLNHRTIRELRNSWISASCLFCPSLLLKTGVIPLDDTVTLYVDVKISSPEIWSMSPVASRADQRRRCLDGEGSAWRTAGFWVCPACRNNNNISNNQWNHVLQNTRKYMVLNLLIGQSQQIQNNLSNTQTDLPLKSLNLLQTSRVFNYFTGFF